MVGHQVSSQQSAPKDWAGGGVWHRRGGAGGEGLRLRQRMRSGPAGERPLPGSGLPDFHPTSDRSRSKEGPCPPGSMSGSQRLLGTGPPPPGSLPEIAPDLGPHTGLLQACLRAWSPSGSRSGLGWILGCIRSPLLPLFLGCPLSPCPDAAQLLCPLPRGCGPAWLDHQPWEGGEHLFVRTPCLPGAPHLPGHLHTLHTRKQARRGGHSCVGCTAARTPSGPLWQPFPLGRWLSQRQCLGGGTLPRGQALPDPEKDSGRPWAGVDVNVGHPQGWALRGGLWSPHC